MAIQAIGRISLHKRRQANHAEGVLPALFAGLKNKRTDKEKYEIGVPRIAAFNAGNANFIIGISLCRDNYELRARGHRIALFGQFAGGDAKARGVHVGARAGQDYLPSGSFLPLFVASFSLL